MSALNTMVGGSHYHPEGGIQPIQFYHANPQLNFQQTNVIKYIYRHRDKKGLEDLKKVVHYTMFEAEFGYPAEDVEKWKKELIEMLMS